MSEQLNIFLLMGQSNMVLGAIEHPDIFMFRDSKWVRAKEPLPSPGSIGLGMSFALELVNAYPSARIGLVHCAVGGSPLSSWVKGAPLYVNCLKCAQLAQSNGEIKGVLWHQGERESKNQELALSYYQRFTDMIKSLREDLEMSGLPVIIGQLGEFLRANERFKYYQIVNKSLKKTARTLPRCGWVSSKGLKDKGDKVHFNSLASREFGRRYAQEYQRLIRSNGLTLLTESG